VESLEWLDSKDPSILGQSVDGLGGAVIKGMDEKDEFDFEVHVVKKQ